MSQTAHWSWVERVWVCYPGLRSIPETCSRAVSCPGQSPDRLAGLPTIILPTGKCARGMDPWVCFHQRSGTEAQQEKQTCNSGRPSNGPLFSGLLSITLFLECSIYLSIKISVTRYACQSRDACTNQGKSTPAPLSLMWLSDLQTHADLTSATTCCP